MLGYFFYEGSDARSGEILFDHFLLSINNLPVTQNNLVANQKRFC